MVAILLMGFSILQMDRDSFVMWSMRIVYIALLVVVLLVTVSRLRFPIIVNQVRRALGSKHVFWRRFILNSCMLAAIVMMLFMVDPVLQHVMILLDLCGFAILSFGNLQIPAAIVREEIARMRLTQHDYFGVGEKTNLGQSLTIVYSMVLGKAVFGFQDGN